MRAGRQSRNASCVPFRGRGPRSGEGVCEGKNDYDILFYVLSPFAQWAADWRSGPRWSILSVLCPVHPFPLRGTSPQGETRDMREKQRVIYFTYHFGVFPIWWLAPPPFRPVGKRVTASGGTAIHAYCRAAYEENDSRCFILPPEQGEVRRSRIGGGERSEPIRRMLIIPYDTESQFRNADFILIARKGDTTTLGLKGRQT